MAARSDRTPRRRRKADDGPDLDFLFYECTGEDPRPRLELPDGVEVGQLANATTDALVAVYDEDGDDADHVAVLCIVVKGATPAAAAAAMIADVQEVARELLHGIATTAEDDHG